LKEAKMQRALHSVFSEPRYYLYGVLIVLALMALLFLFSIQTSVSSGRG
jgi:hypothetical protein